MEIHSQVEQDWSVSLGFVLTQCHLHAWFPLSSGWGLPRRERCPVRAAHYQLKRDSFNFAERSVECLLQKRKEDREPSRHPMSPLVNSHERSRKRKRNKQATQSTRWMPWRCLPMKDAETGETYKGSCIQAMSLMYPNGATHPE